MFQRAVEGPVDWRGELHAQNFCKGGTMHGFEVKVESYMGPTVDDSAVNGLRFWCTDGSVIESGSAENGEWKGKQSCKEGNKIVKIQAVTGEEMGDSFGVQQVSIFCDGSAGLETISSFDDSAFPSSNRQSVDIQCPNSMTPCGLQNQIKPIGKEIKQAAILYPKFYEEMKPDEVGLATFNILCCHQSNV